MSPWSVSCRPCAARNRKFDRIWEFLDYYTTRPFTRARETQCATVMLCSMVCFFMQYFTIGASHYPARPETANWTKFSIFGDPIPTPFTNLKEIWRSREHSQCSPPCRPNLIWIVRLLYQVPLRSHKL